MCAVSMVMDSKADDWLRRYWNDQPLPWSPPLPQPALVPLPTAQEVEEFRRLLDRAQQYDREHDQPDCGLEGKRQKLRDMAKELGVEIDFV